MIGQLAAAASMIAFVPDHMGELARNGPHAACIGRRMSRLGTQTHSTTHISCSTVHSCPTR